MKRGGIVDWFSVFLIVLILYYFAVMANNSNSNLTLFAGLMGVLILIHLARENGWASF